MKDNNENEPLYVSFHNLEVDGVLPLGLWPVEDLHSLVHKMAVLIIIKVQSSVCI